MSSLLICHPFCFQTLSKVSRGEHAILDQAREVIQKELEEEILERLRKIKKSVLDALPGVGSFSSGANMELRKKYASMMAAEVVMAVFNKAEGVFSPRMTKVSDTSKDAIKVTHIQDT